MQIRPTNYKNKTYKSKILVAIKNFPNQLVLSCIEKRFVKRYNSSYGKDSNRSWEQGGVLLARVRYHQRRMVSQQPFRVQRC